MSDIDWERRHEAFEAIWSKLEEILTKLDAVVLNRQGSPTRIDRTEGGEILGAPGSGKKLVLTGFFLSVDADEKVQLRWNGATGTVFLELPTKGCIGALPIVEVDEGGENENLYLTKSGSGNARGMVYTKTESV